MGWAVCRRLQITHVSYWHISIDPGEYVRLQLLSRLSSQHVQHDRVGDQLRVVGVLLQRRRQRGLGLGQSAEMQLRDGLADDRQRRRCARGRGQFLVDVEGRLVLLAALSGTHISTEFPAAHTEPPREGRGERGDAQLSCPPRTPPGSPEASPGPSASPSGLP